MLREKFRFPEETHNKQFVLKGVPLMKKTVSLFLALVLLLFGTTFSSVLALGCTASSANPFLRFLESAPIESLLSTQEQEALLQAYADEFEFLNQKHGNAIQAVNENAINLIKAEAVSFSGSDVFEFDALLEQISALRFEKAVAAFNAGDASAQTQSSPLRVHPDQLEVRNAVRTTVVPYGALTAKYISEAPTGTTLTTSGSLSLSVEKGSILKSYKLTTGVEVSVEYSLTGPSSTDQVKPGMYATHRVAFGVLYGRIERYTYDLYYSYTGELHSHNEIISVRDEDGYYCTFLASYGAPTYLRHAKNNNYFTFTSRSSCVDSVCKNSGTYID